MERKVGRERGPRLWGPARAGPADVKKLSVSGGQALSRRIKNGLTLSHRADAHPCKAAREAADQSGRRPHGGLLHKPRLNGRPPRKSSL